jgi:hypothetical protein
MDELSIIVVENGSWIKKEAGVRRWVSEKLFSDYRNQMDNLREIDDQIQNWLYDLNKLYKNAKAAQTQKKALDMVFWLSEINKRLKLAINQGKNVADLSESQIDELFGPNEQSILEDYFGEPDEFKLAQAGILDAAANRLARWKLESMYKKRLEVQRLAMQALMRLAESTVVSVNSALKTMKKARSEGNIQNYVGGLSRIAKVQAQFESQFKNIFDKNFKDLALRLKMQQAAKEIKEEKPLIPETLPQTAPLQQVPDLESAPPRQLPSIFDEEEIPGTGQTLPGEDLTQLSKTTPATPLPQALLPEEPEPLTNKLEPIPPMPETSDMTKFELSPEGVSEKSIDNVLEMTPPMPTAEEASEPNRKKKQKKSIRKSKNAGDEMEKIIINAKHAAFYQELEKAASTSNPHLLAAMMLKYSEQIDEIDPEKSAELLTLAAGILDA